VSCFLAEDETVQPDVLTDEARYTRAEVVELDRPAWHLISPRSAAGVTHAGFKTRTVRRRDEQAAHCREEKTYSTPSMATAKEYLTREWLPAVRATIRSASLPRRPADCCAE
jgi:hypothetical protein